MGMMGFFLFGEQDSVLVSEIAKLHKVSVEVVEEHYRKMLEAIRKDVQA